MIQGQGRAHGREKQHRVCKYRLDQGSAEPRQGTARPGHGQWSVMDNAALGQVVDGSVYKRTVGG